MRNDDREYTRVGCSITLDSIGFILSMIFMILELCGVISWSWWLVFLPIIVDVGATILIILTAVIVLAIKTKRDEREESKSIRRLKK